MHILLVEDNEHDIFFVQAALKSLKKQIELTVVHDGVQAIDYLFHREPYTQAAQPDIITLRPPHAKQNGD